MRYAIECDGIRIAKFLHESDCDHCLVALEEAYEDVDFEVIGAVQEEGESMPTGDASTI